REQRALEISLAVLALTGFATYEISQRVLVGVLVAWAALVVVTTVKLARLLANAGEITPRQFAHLYPLVEELRQRFTMPQTRVFIIESPELNAFAFGFREPYAVVLHSALVEALNEQELKSVIGHEMGHIKFGHTRLGLLLGGLDVGGVPLP